jgi:hypothetical protein
MKLFLSHVQAGRFVFAVQHAKACRSSFSVASLNPSPSQLICIPDGVALIARTYHALFFVLMNVEDLSHFVHFDRDLRADSDIPEHATLGSEAITPLPSRRRQRHLGLAIINR